MGFRRGLIDQLFVRHWDKFTHPEKRNNLFVVKLKVDGSSVTIDGEARNVMAGEGLETPVSIVRLCQSHFPVFLMPSLP